MNCLTVSAYFIESGRLFQSFGRVEAGWDDGISSSESDWFFCGDLIGEIGGGLSLISASMAMIWL